MCQNDKNTNIQTSINMKTKIILIGLLIGMGILYSCSMGFDNSINKYSISGVAQKGPYIKGSQIEISELTESLIQTGKNFNSELKNDLGAFDVVDIELKSTKIEITADGFYFNEVQGSLSQSRLRLKSLSDISDKSSVNVNIMTHVIIDRIKTRIKKGENYNASKMKAQNELLAIFQISTDNISDFESLNISSQDSENGILIALSCIIQGRNSVADLSKLLADFKEDFGDNGKIDNANIRSELINNAKLLDTSSIRTNMEKYYNALGLSIKIPTFENHITKFIDSFDSKKTLEISYPTKGDFGDNLLAKASNSEIVKAQTYSFSAIFPSEIKLLLKLKINKIDGNVTWATDKTKQTNWFGVPTNGNEIKGMAVGTNADMPIIFTGTGKIEVQVETFKIGVVDEYLETKKILLTIK